VGLINAKKFFHKKIIIVRMCFGKAHGSGVMKFSSLIHYSYISYLDFTVTKKHIDHPFLQEFRPDICWNLALGLAVLHYHNVHKGSRTSWLSNALGDREEACRCRGLCRGNILSLAGWMNSNIQDAFSKPIKGEEI